MTGSLLNLSSALGPVATLTCLRPLPGGRLNTSRASQHIETWKVNDTNMSRLFSLIYGSEWLGELLSAIQKLKSLHVDTPHKFALSFIRGACGSLNYRRGQEIVDLANILRLRVKVERPTFEQLKMIGVTIVQPSCLTVFRKPKACDLEDPSGFSLSEVVRRMLEDKELSSWSQYRGARITRDRAGANPTETAGLPGPPMTPAARRAAGSTAPKTDQGIMICWNYNSHLGCAESACTRSREFYKNYGDLTPAVKIALIKRYGFKRKIKLQRGR